MIVLDTLDLGDETYITNIYMNNAFLLLHYVIFINEVDVVKKQKDD